MASNEIDDNSIVWYDGNNLEMMMMMMRMWARPDEGRGWQAVLPMSTPDPPPRQELGLMMMTMNTYF